MALIHAVSCVSVFSTAEGAARKRRRSVPERFASGDMVAYDGLPGRSSSRTRVSSGNKGARLKASGKAGAGGGA